MTFEQGHSMLGCGVPHLHKVDPSLCMDSLAKQYQVKDLI